MILKALGVNSAFSVGVFHDAVLLSDVESILKTGNPEAQLAAIKSKVKRLYDPKWQSNFLLEFDMPNKRGKADEPYRLLVDCGCDIRHALAAIGLTFNDIDGVYISHPHSDHIGGIEGFALSTIFNPFYTKAKKDWCGDRFVVDKLIELGEKPFPPDFAKPDLFVHPKVLIDLRAAVRPGLDTMQGVSYVRLETYFNIIPVGKDPEGHRVSHRFQDGKREWKMTPVFAMHVISATEEMPSYGLTLEATDGTYVLLPTDTQHMVPPQLEVLYKKATAVYMDCETGKFASGVHPHINDLIKGMNPEIQKKCYLYHYQADPEYPEGMFKGTLRVGDVHQY
jgi:hypothetical protein